MIDLAALRDRVSAAPVFRARGRLVDAVGPLLEAEVPGAVIGGLCTIGDDRMGQVVGIKGRRAVIVPLEPTEGVVAGAEVRLRSDRLSVPVGPALIGRVLDGLGRPIDGGPRLKGRRVPLTIEAPDPLGRPIIRDRLVTGVRVLDGLLPLGRGQRVSIMAGSGVGKSTLLAMLARNVQADVNVICLVGERGREVQEFLEETLGQEGRARSVMVVVSSDRSPALQVKAAFVATTIAEYFRDQGKHVLLLMDSLTRLALAQRQIGLASGEPPTTRGFTPSVFGMLPRLLERAGTAPGGGSITGIYTVLVEGDDIHDPVGDAVRGIVDGHLVLSRRLASHGHFPAVDVLGSVSRLMPRVATAEELALAARLRANLATWAENEELIRLGAYREGSSPEVDEAIALHPAMTAFLKQAVGEKSTLAETVAAMQALTQ